MPELPKPPRVRATLPTLSDRHDLLRDFNLVKKRCPKNSGTGNPHFQAMPELKRFFRLDVFPNVLMFFMCVSIMRITNRAIGNFAIYFAPLCGQICHLCIWYHLEAKFAIIETTPVSYPIIWVRCAPGKVFIRAGKVSNTKNTFKNSGDNFTIQMNYFLSSGICLCMTRRNGFGFCGSQ